MIQHWRRIALAACLLTTAVGLGARTWAQHQSAASAAVQPQKIVAIGDSITYGLRDDAALGGWVGRLASMIRVLYPSQNYTTINAGINGDTSSGVVKRLKHDVIDQKPNLVILAIGTNDFDYHVPAATFESNLRTIIATIKQQTHAAILVQSFLPEALVAGSVLKQEAAYNALVPAVCRQLNVGYEDLFNTFLALGRAAMANLRHDSEHPTAAGYRFMAAFTLAVLESGYLSQQGTIVQASNAPGTDDLLPDDELGL